MFRELNLSLRRLFREFAPEGSLLRGDGRGIQVAFEIPDKEWADRLSALTLNCYLYDIREDLDRSPAEPAVSGARAFIECAYRITAWSPALGDPEEPGVFYEHQLLSEALALLLEHRTLPEVLLSESLTRWGRPYARLAPGEGGRGSPAEFWSSLGLPQRPALELVVAVAFGAAKPRAPSAKRDGSTRATEAVAARP